MPGRDIIALAGQVVEVLEPGLVRVELGNGHRVVAHPIRQSREWAGRLKVGDAIRLELSPFDMSTARIVGQAAENGTMSNGTSV